jgi:hypothetical protein
MSHICSLLAFKRGLGKDFSEQLLYASTMHDVGKIGIPDSILPKPGKLSSEEWQVMQQHPKIGARIIGDNDSRLIALARETALYHHEKWDGTGYPHEIAGEKIPISARIAAISDVFDALSMEGARIEISGSNPLPRVRGQVSLEFSLPGQEEVLSITGEICWTEKAKGGERDKHSVGIKFGTQESSVRSVLWEFISKSARDEHH